ncbi:hypothetical protein NEMBOFW57_009661 [Staphylotrichum longicolle]|uniref:Uncharacterized protein n=1 Tax=Staphylotrichum longicolle TaxID=669026 RepID=A0AAD4EPE8_9PEZI|nr:hypothetical protein NEMBOFW57_009661 [Staphylotrichum longicolle]
MSEDQINDRHHRDYEYDGQPAAIQNAELIARLGRRFGEHQAAAQSNNALKSDGTPWKAKYEAAAADVTRLEQENWELQDNMEDALEHIEILKRALRNSIPIRLQGEPMEAEDFCALNFPLRDTRMNGGAG